MVRVRNKNLKMCPVFWRFTESSKLFSLLSEPDQSPDCLWFVCHHFHMCHDYSVKPCPSEKLTPLFGGKLTPHTIKAQRTNRINFHPSNEKLKWPSPLELFMGNSRHKGLSIAICMLAGESPEISSSLSKTFVSCANLYLNSH